MSERVKREKSKEQIPNPGPKIHIKLGFTFYERATTKMKVREKLILKKQGWEFAHRFSERIARFFGEKISK